MVQSGAGLFWPGQLPLLTPDPGGKFGTGAGSPGLGAGAAGGGGGAGGEVSSASVATIRRPAHEL